MQQDAVYTVSMGNHFPTAYRRTISVQLFLLSMVDGDIMSMNCCVKNRLMFLPYTQIRARESSCLPTLRLSSFHPNVREQKIDGGALGGFEHVGLRGGNHAPGCLFVWVLSCAVCTIGIAKKTRESLKESTIISLSFILSQRRFGNVYLVATLHFLLAICII